MQDRCDDSDVTGGAVASPACTARGSPSARGNRGRHAYLKCLEGTVSLLRLEYSEGRRWLLFPPAFGLKNMPRTSHPDRRTVLAGFAARRRRPRPAVDRARPGRRAHHPKDPVQRRGHPGGRPRHLDHVQCRQRPRRARRLRRGDARLLRRGRPHDRFFADVRLVAGRDRPRPAQARPAGCAVLGRQGLDLLRRARSRADRDVARPLGRAALRPASGPQPAVLGGASAGAAADEGRGPRALLSASPRRKGAAIATSNASWRRSRSISCR